jgi:hypothetical protein
MAIAPATRLPRPGWWPEVAAWALWLLAMLRMAATFWLHQRLVQAGRVVASRRLTRPVGGCYWPSPCCLPRPGWPRLRALRAPGTARRPTAAGVVAAAYYPPCAAAALACLALVLLLPRPGRRPLRAGAGGRTIHGGGPDGLLRRLRGAAWVRLEAVHRRVAAGSGVAVAVHQLPGTVLPPVDMGDPQGVGLHRATVDGK